MSMTSRYALSVMCRDSVGLVARLTDCVCRLSGEVEVLRQGVLQGYFVFTLMAAFPEGTDEQKVRETIESAGAPGEFVVSIMPRSEKVAAPAQTGASFILTVLGEREDVAPVLRKLTSYLSDHRINIEGLTCEPRSGKSVMTGVLTIPSSVDIRGLRLDLHEILKADEVNVSLVHEDIFNATSRIEMPNRRPA
jgi:predicted amino acid-binding ACT domain protein